ncbi:hypothetical protein NR352_23965 [Enterobacter soli]|uniref:hypothetical protein n=1 Tax=Enterobacter soli TaxID=885040 RepID=UPI0021497172|nr:hypothetical protein [Enterobacter soli]MCR1319985.1 hypothetical protein [Enterobacter soli]
MSTITKERIANLLQFNSEGSDCQANAEQWEVHELARIALASLEAEPVATLDVQSRRPDGNKFALVFSSAEHKLPDDVYFLYRHAQPAPVVPEGLNPATTDLVLRFASALADKLYKAEQKYGRSTDWMKDDWYDDCLQSLWEHIEKGDPRDVAAYCAFMWYHGWVTTDYDRNVQNACRAAMLHGAQPVTTAYKLPFEQWLSQQTGTIDVECGCVMTEVFFHWLRVAYETGNSPVIPDGWVIVPVEPTAEMISSGIAAHFERSQTQIHDRPAPGPMECAYVAMLAAAPQQE